MRRRYVGMGGPAGYVVRVDVWSAKGDSGLCLGGGGGGSSGGSGDNDDGNGGGVFVDIIQCSRCGYPPPPPPSSSSQGRKLESRMKSSSQQHLHREGDIAIHTARSISSGG